jgi:hypothetical protein
VQHVKEKFLVPEATLAVSVPSSVHQEGEQATPGFTQLNGLSDHLVEDADEADDDITMDVDDTEGGGGTSSGETASDEYEQIRYGTVCVRRANFSVQQYVRYRYLV